MTTESTEKLLDLDDLELASGWSRGARHHAECMAKADLRELERRAA